MRTSVCKYVLVYWSVLSASRPPLRKSKRYRRRRPSFTAAITCIANRMTFGGRLKLTSRRSSAEGGSLLKRGVDAARTELQRLEEDYSLEVEPDGLFCARSEDRTIVARNVVVATGTALSRLTGVTPRGMLSCALAASGVHNRAVAALRSSATIRNSPCPAELAGRTENNRVANFAGPAHLIGGFADVEITAALPNSLRATLSQN